MLPDGRRLGAHLPLGTGMVKAADRAAAIGADAIQIFSDNPTAWRRRAALPPELPSFRARLTELGIEPLVIHAAYLVNLAGGDPLFFERSVQLMAHELRTADAYGARLVNVHIGSHRGAGAETGIDRLIDGLILAFALADDVRVPADGGPRVVLENSAGSGYGLGVTLEQLQAIQERARERGLDLARIAFCLDIAHLWGAGYPVDDPLGVDALVAEFDARIGLERLALIHLNDTRSERGSHQDRHEHLAAGRIGAAGLRAFLVHPALGHVPFMLETPGMGEGYDAVNLDRARDLVAGRPLPTLPPGAFSLPSARARTGPPPGPPPEERVDATDRGDAAVAGRAEGSASRQ